MCWEQEGGRSEEDGGGVEGEAGTAMEGMAARRKQKRRKCELVTAARLAKKRRRGRVRCESVRRGTHLYRRNTFGFSEK